MFSYKRRQRKSIASSLALIAISSQRTRCATIAFHACPLLGTKQQISKRTRVFAGIGSGGNDRPPPPGNNNNDDNRSSWDKFLNPDHEESYNLRKAREYLSENSLPISFYADEEGNESNNKPDVGGIVDKLDGSDNPGSSGLVRHYSAADFAGQPTSDLLATNPYMAVVSKLTPSELISKFASNAHPRVQNAVRTTILGLIGGLPKLAFETKTITTGQKLASLMFQLQMTGYMFKNAEYRLSLQQSLGMNDAASPLNNDKLLISGINEGEKLDPLAGNIRGKLRIKYKGTTLEEVESSSSSSNSVDIEVDAAAYMSELRSEVAKLRDELVLVQKQQEDSLSQDLLTFIRTLPPRELQSLTNTMSQDVLVAMKGLVNAVMAGIGDGKIGPDTITEQSGESIAQLCMWQLVIGYNLRTLEVREEMRKSLAGSLSADFFWDDDSGVDLSQPGSLE